MRSGANRDTVKKNFNFIVTCGLEIQVAVERAPHQSSYVLLLRMLRRFCEKEGLDI